RAPAHPRAARPHHPTWLSEKLPVVRAAGPAWAEYTGGTTPTEEPMSASPKIDVDLYSDTVTKPTTAMRRFMCDAEVGDEQKGEDPTVNQLQDVVAGLLGKEAAVFLPSGTMCNEIALRVHCRPGEEMLAHRTAHPIHFEAGGPAALGGVNVRALDGARG